jgi:hypothetical protein
MIFSVPSEVFADHLSVTFSPDNSPLFDLTNHLASIGGEPVQSTQPNVDSYRLGDGYLFLRQSAQFHKVEIRGQALFYLRLFGLLPELLSLLAESPHSVTRLDAAADYALDYPTEVIPKLKRKYPDRQAKLGRKSVQVTEILNPRFDGKQSGTWYAGERGKTRMVLRVYDKMHQMQRKFSQLIPPTVRVEIEFGRKIGATLRDALEPASIFHHHLSPALVAPDPTVRPWECVDDLGWVSKPRDVIPFVALQRLVEESKALEKMIDLAHQIGCNGPDTLLQLIKRRMD